MTIEEGLPIKRLRGDKILVRRYEYPTKTDSGLILPTSFTKQSEDVNQVHDLPKYQNSGEVIAIGDGVEEGVYELGDVVHFQPNYYQMAIFDKSDLAFFPITLSKYFGSNPSPGLIILIFSLV